MLSSLEKISLPSQGLEIIAVNNSSTDNTAEVLEYFKNRLDMKIFYEEKQGKSFALNRGISNSYGDLLVFTDDDIIASPDWLTNFERAAQTKPEIAIFAGQIRHHWDSPAPKWLIHLADLGLSYGGTPSKLQEEIISSDQVKGANLMVRRASLGEIRFCEDDDVVFLGGNKSKGGEDIRFSAEISQHNGLPLFVPGACIQHIVRTQEICLDSVFRRYVRIGSSVGSLECSGSRTIYGCPVWSLEKAFVHTMRCFSKIITGQQCSAAEEMVHLAMLIGRIKESFLIRKSKN